MEASGVGPQGARAGARVVPDRVEWHYLDYGMLYVSPSLCHFRRLADGVNPTLSQTIVSPRDCERTL